MSVIEQMGKDFNDLTDFFRKAGIKEAPAEPKKYERKTFVVGCRIPIEYKEQYKAMDRLDREVLRKHIEQFFEAQTMKVSR